MRIARLYLRVSTDEQDLSRQIGIEDSTRSAGYYIAGVYREKASGARADGRELLEATATIVSPTVRLPGDRAHCLARRAAPPGTPGLGWAQRGQSVESPLNNANREHSMKKRI